jgi:hypothetical protein
MFALRLRGVGVAVTTAMALVACDRAADTGAPPPRPQTAVRVVLPSTGPEKPGTLPISITQVCDASAMIDAPRSMRYVLRDAFRPASAFAQERKNVHIAKSNGDVHLEMLNGVRYDFQGVGEFVALKSQNGAMELQVRHQPFSSSRTVSVATAVAMNVAGDVVAMYATGPSPLMVNHRSMSFSDAVLRLPRGGEIQRQGNGFVIVWPGKSQVRVLYGSYLDYIVTLCPSEQSAISGLLGSPEAKPDAGLTTRTGTAVTLAGLSREEFRQRLYRVFGDSWRITQQESLFDYDKGQTTTSFTDLDFPYEPDPLASVTDAQRQSAEAACRRAGLTDGRALAECILDVAATGDQAFAENNAFLESMYLKSRRAERGGGSWECKGPHGTGGWECIVHDLNGARVGSTMTLVIETLQAGQKTPESLTCGPITTTFDAPCTDKTRGIGFQGNQVTERYTLQSGELSEIKSRGGCRPPKSPGEAC